MEGFGGLTGTRVYADINGDGILDFCRVSRNGDFTCTLGSKGEPNPFNGKSFDVTSPEKKWALGSAFTSVRGKGTLDVCFLVVDTYLDAMRVEQFAATPVVYVKCYPLNGPHGLIATLRPSLDVQSPDAGTVTWDLDDPEILRSPAIDPGIPIRARGLTLMAPDVAHSAEYSRRRGPSSLEQKTIG
jgi:hypothetical protein